MANSVPLSVHEILTDCTGSALFSLGNATATAVSAARTGMESFMVRD